MNSPAFPMTEIFYLLVENSGSFSNCLIETVNFKHGPNDKNNKNDDRAKVVISTAHHTARS